MYSLFLLLSRKQPRSSAKDHIKKKKKYEYQCKCTFYSLDICVSIDHKPGPQTSLVLDLTLIQVFLWGEYNNSNTR